ncbi:MAG TPA: GatB/YqeY domain-containing protein [Gemmatimonadaceae bacterium]|nr:GatB/YqeY domain-containing protein [Gemmatimonadaceae bacterium]
MSALGDQVQRDLIAARKAQDKPAILLLGTILADIKNHRIQIQRDLTDEDVVEVLRRGIKRRRESIELFEKGGRSDLAAKERAEVTRLETYLPAGVSEEVIRATVREVIAGGATTIGAVMGQVLPRFKGRAEGATINRIAREELAKPS